MATNRDIILRTCDLNPRLFLHEIAEHFGTTVEHVTKVLRPLKDSDLLTWMHPVSLPAEYIDVQPAKMDVTPEVLLERAIKLGIDLDEKAPPRT